MDDKLKDFIIKWGFVLSVLWALPRFSNLVNHGVWTLSKVSGSHSLGMQELTRGIYDITICALGSIGEVAGGTALEWWVSFV